MVQSPGGQQCAPPIKSGTTVCTLAKNLAPEEKPQVICATYATLNQKMTCTISDELAQTCWLEKESKGELHVDT